MFILYYSPPNETDVQSQTTWWRRRDHISGFNQIEKKAKLMGNNMVICGKKIGKIEAKDTKCWEKKVDVFLGEIISKSN